MARPRATVHIECTTRADGDFHLEGDADVLDARRRALVALPWSQPDEVHGVDVLRVDHPGQHDRAVADGLVTAIDRAVLGIWVGDCAPVALVTRTGAIGAVHAGWRGLRDGVLDVAVAALRAIAPAGDHLEAVLGPCIHPCCYEFGSDDLDQLAERFGPGVRGVTLDGRAALDVPSAVRAALAEVGVDRVTSFGGCTACRGDLWFSHRARGERGRQMMAVWRTAA